MAKRGFCVNCNEPLQEKKKFKFRLANYPLYKYDYQKCPNCNAVQFVVNRLNSSGIMALTAEELAMLPKYIRFDENKPEEVVAAAFLSRYIKEIGEVRFVSSLPQ